MTKYRKKPVVIEAVQFDDDSFEKIVEWIGEDNLGDGTNPDEGLIEIITLEGSHNARIGDWIIKSIKGIKGEFYPIKNDIFIETYDRYKETP